jgi:site-specific DNA recombinase
MSGKWNNDQAYYLCRFPAEYALANRLSHPKNVYLREADLLGKVDNWLTELFAPDGIDATVTQLAEQAAQPEDPATTARVKQPRPASPTMTRRSAATGRTSIRAETRLWLARGSPRPRPRR